MLRPHTSPLLRLEAVYGDQRRATSAARSGEKAPQALVGQQHRAQVQQQVQGMVPRAGPGPG